MLATALATLAFAGKERTMSKSAKAGKLKTLNKRNTKPRRGLSRFTTVPPALSFKAFASNHFRSLAAFLRVYASDKHLQKRDHLRSLKQSCISTHSFQYVVRNALITVTYGKSICKLNSPSGIRVNRNSPRLFNSADSIRSSSFCRCTEASLTKPPSRGNICPNNSRWSSTFEIRT